MGRCVLGRGCAIALLHSLALGLRKGALSHVQALLALSVVDVYERVPNKSDADACLKALDALHRRVVHTHRLQQSVRVDTRNVVADPLLTLDPSEGKACHRPQTSQTWTPLWTLCF